MRLMPLSCTVTRSVSFSPDVMTTFLGTLTNLNGIFSSCSKLSLRVVISQKMPATARKNRNIRNSLPSQPNR